MRRSPSGPLNSKTLRAIYWRLLRAGRGGAAARPSSPRHSHRVADRRVGLRPRVRDGPAAVLVRAAGRDVLVLGRAGLARLLLARGVDHVRRPLAGRSREGGLADL